METAELAVGVDEETAPLIGQRQTGVEIKGNGTVAVGDGKWLVIQVLLIHNQFILGLNSCLDDFA